MIHSGRNVKSMDNYRLSVPDNHLKSHKKLKKKAKKNLNQTVQGMTKKEKNERLATLMSDTKKVQELAEKRRLLNGVGTLTEYWNYCDIPFNHHCQSLSSNVDSREK